MNCPYRSTQGEQTIDALLDFDTLGPRRAANEQASSRNCVPWIQNDKVVCTQAPFRLSRPDRWRYIREMALDETGIELHSIHAAITNGYTNETWREYRSNASSCARLRLPATSETAAALDIERKIETRFLVVYLATTTNQAPDRDNDQNAAMHNLEEQHNLTSAVLHDLAHKVIPNRLSTPGSPIDLLEPDSNFTGIGICFDFGHACLVGYLFNEIEITPR